MAPIGPPDKNDIIRGQVQNAAISALLTEIVKRLFGFFSKSKPEKKSGSEK